MAVISENKEEGSQYLAEMLYTLTAVFALPNHKLTMKTALSLMLLDYTDQVIVHVHHVRCILKVLYSNLPLAKSVKIDNSATVLALLRMPCSHDDSSFPVQEFTTTQFSAGLCFRITEDRAQGQLFSVAVWI